MYYDEEIDTQNNVLTLVRLNDTENCLIPQINTPPRSSTSRFACDRDVLEKQVFFVKVSAGFSVPLIQIG